MSKLYIKIKKLEISELESSIIKDTYSTLLKYSISNKLCPLFKDLPPADNFNGSYILEFDSKSDPRVENVLDLLQQMGRKCYPRILPFDAAKQSSVMHVLKKYSKKELNSCSLYYNFTWYIKDKFSSIPVISLHDGNYACIAKNMKSSWNKSFIAVHTMGILAVNETGKSILEEAGLVGLTFNKITWCDPEYVERDFFTVRPTVTMPQSLCQLVQDADGCFQIVNGPYIEPELLFDKESVNELGYFDFASTIEMVRSDKHHIGGRLPLQIISKKFKSVLEDNGVHLDPYPVRLV